MKKSELNQNIHLSEGNIKSKNTDDVMFLTWSLPCKVTCPHSTEMCRKRCFAQKNENFDNVVNSRKRNLEETKKVTFDRSIVDWINYYLDSKKAQNRRIFVRIHTSGDFYNLDYLEKWSHIAQLFKDDKRILFQAYTKSMPILDKYINLQRGFYNNNSTDQEIIKETNIHFVWSIWNDTPKEYTDRAKELGLQTFTALPKQEIEDKKSVFICGGDCGHCKQCYTGKAKEIVIPYH